MKAAIQRSLVLLGLGLLLAGVTARLSEARVPMLPSPCWGGCDDDVEYFPSGAEFKLSRDAAAMQAAKLEANPLGVFPAPLAP